MTVTTYFWLVAAFALNVTALFMFFENRRKMSRLSFGMVAFAGSYTLEYFSIMFGY